MRIVDPIFSRTPFNFLLRPPVTIQLSQSCTDEVRSNGITKAVNSPVRFKRSHSSNHLLNPRSRHLHPTGGSGGVFRPLSADPRYQFFYSYFQHQSQKYESNLFLPWYPQDMEWSRPQLSLIIRRFHRQLDLGHETAQCTKFHVFEIRKHLLVIACQLLFSL